MPPRKDADSIALFNAARENNLAEVNRLIEKGVDANKAKKDGRTPLFVACQFNNLNIVERLLNVPGIDVNKHEESYHMTPLYIACDKGNLKIVEILLAAPGIDVNIPVKEDYNTPLSIACMKGYVDIVERLLAAPGIDVNKPKNNPLYFAVSYKRLELLDKLLSVPEIDVNGTTVLYMAAKDGSIDILKRLLQFPGIDVNRVGWGGITPLGVAVYFNNLNIVNLLLAVPGIDVNKPRDIYTASPLYMACDQGYVETVKRLLNVPGIDATKVINDADRFSPEISDIILQGKEKKKEDIWQGWTRGDVERMNEIFDDSMASNITLCPICLKTTTRDTGCMHMKHNCKSLRGFYHTKLYNLYKINNEIHWCTICGRIGGYGNDFTFRHYKLGYANQDKPGMHGPTMTMDADCATRSGGGGLREKLMRFQRVRETALALNTPEYVGKISEKDAKEKLVEAMWDAPLILNNDINTILRTKTWNIPNTAFPLNVAQPELPNAPNIPMPSTHLDPIVHPDEADAFQNAIMISDKDILQFRHEGNLHDQEGQQISRQAFFSFLQSVGINETEEGFLKCWQYVPESKRREGDLHCGVMLYPREVQIALGLTEVPTEGENSEYRKLYELYRKKFNSTLKTGGRRTRRRRVYMKNRTMRV